MPSNPYPHHPNLAGLLGLNISHKSGHIFRCSNLFQHLDDLVALSGQILGFILWILGCEGMCQKNPIESMCFWANYSKILNLNYVRSFWGVRIPLLTKPPCKGWPTRRLVIGSAHSTQRISKGPLAMGRVVLLFAYVAWLVAPTKCYKS